MSHIPSHRPLALAIAGRVLLAILFLGSGLSKLAAPAATQAYIASAGIPAPHVAYLASVTVEVLGGLALLFGFRTRIAATALIAFTVVATGFFHTQLADPNQMANFMKNVAIIGGLLHVMAFARNGVRFHRHGRWFGRRGHRGHSHDYHPHGEPSRQSQSESAPSSRDGAVA